MYRLPPIFLLLLLSCARSPKETRIAFGSCGHEDEPQSILSLAASYRPDLFIFLGDNIYGDTDNMDTLLAKYRRWAEQPAYKQLVAATRVLATWDDHDFGRNDAGKYYPYKEQSKEIFLAHFKEPTNSARRQHPGIYHAEYIPQGDRTIQVILLDVRSFRSDLLPYDTAAKLPREKYFYPLDYRPHVSADSTLLGAEQWKWLERELSKPADLRLICSGTQFAIEYNGYEAWANFPHEQKRMLDLIRTTGANDVYFLTGDVHYGEISRIENPGSQPIYDITSSGITSTWDFPTQNVNRVEGPVMDNHFGLLTITWEKKPIVKIQLIDKTNNVRVEYEVGRPVRPGDQETSETSETRRPVRPGSYSSSRLSGLSRLFVSLSRNFVDAQAFLYPPTPDCVHFIAYACI